MAFDGITIANLRWEFAHTIEGGKIAKIAQPEKDELLITIKNNRENYRLQISAWTKTFIANLLIKSSGVKM